MNRGVPALPTQEVFMSSGDVSRPRSFFSGVPFSATPKVILSRRLAERLLELALVGLHEWSKFPEDCANVLAMSLSSLELLWWSFFIERSLHYVVHVPARLIVVLFKIEAPVSLSALHHLHACEVWTCAIFRQLTDLLSAGTSWAVGRPGSLSGSLRPVHSAPFLMNRQQPRSRRSSWRGSPLRGGNHWAGLRFCLYKTAFIVPSPRGRLAAAPAAAATSLCRLSSTHRSRHSAPGQRMPTGGSGPARRTRGRAC